MSGRAAPEPDLTDREARIAALVASAPPLPRRTLDLLKRAVAAHASPDAEHADRRAS